MTKKQKEQLHLCMDITSKLLRSDFDTIYLKDESGGFTQDVLIFNAWLLELRTLIFELNGNEL